MNVICIFPITNNIQQAPLIMNEFKDFISKRLSILGATKVEIKFAGTEYVYVPINETLEGQPKGKGILQCLKNTPENPDVVICCDGSGKIPYSYIPDIFQEITSDSSIVCVMTNRVGNKAISPCRYLIERFEIFSLKRYHKSQKEISDGQCGLWAYKAKPQKTNGMEKNITLRAEGYDIELDLLDEVLSKTLNFSFVSINLPNIPVQTSFSFSDNLKKMNFLINKNCHLKDSLYEYFLEFEKLDEFSSYREDIGVLNIWNSYKQEVIKILTR